MIAKLRATVILFCIFFASLYLIVIFTPLVSWYGGKLAGKWTDPDGNVLVVLAGGELGDGFPANNTLLRCYYASIAYRSGHFRKIVVAGYQVSAAMREILACSGVPAGVILMENRSTSTRESAIYSAKLLAGEPGSKVLLTSDIHMFRAVRCFRKAGIEVDPRPIPDARKRATSLFARWPAFLDEVEETIKIVYYKLRGWI